MYFQKANVDMGAADSQSWAKELVIISKRDKHDSRLSCRGLTQVCQTNYIIVSEAGMQSYLDEEKTFDLSYTALSGHINN